MKNILRIMQRDLRKITGSVVAMITIMGLCIIPCLYAWFNIFSNWSPYESDATGRISVAVTNLDEGSSVAGLKINVGDKIVEALEANDDIGWVFVEGESEALKGVHAGNYYAALVIPENFSEDVLSFTRGDLTNPKIRYYENEKKNAIAPKITGKAKTALQEEVNAAFVETLASYVTDAAEVTEANGADPSQLLSDLADRIDDLSGDINSCITLADSAAGLTDAAGNLMKVSGNFIGSTQDVLTANDKVLEAAEKELAKERKLDTAAIEKAVKDAKDTAESLKTLKTITVEILSTDAAFNAFLANDREMKAASEEQAKAVRSEGFTALASEFDQLAATLGDISSGLSGLNSGMDHAQREAALKNISDDIDKAVGLADTIQDQIKSDIDESIETALSNTRSSLSSFRKNMSSANKDLGSLSSKMGSYTGSLASLKSSIEKTSSGLSSLQDGAEDLSGLLYDVSGNELLQQISGMMANDEAAVAEYLHQGEDKKEE